ncbi:ABC transporter permease [Pseudooceanicola sp. 200-1SW]|uniref:ABC transporter permease n=1 Tax=Pseudooceanicola sp. 200-1SW TaxID=3425949 RepID=UPI003D7F53DE
MSETQTETAPETGAPAEQGPLAAALRNRNLILGGLLTLVFLGAALLSFLWVPYDVIQMEIANKIKPPYADHLLGTDHYGRDILSMLMVGARTSIAVAVLAVGIGMIVGVPLGLWAAARRGSLMDEIIMRGNDLVFAFPSLVIAVMITAAFGPSATNAIVAIGIFNIPVFARITRSGALTLWTRDFILAARVAGKGSARISFEHILPNVLNLLIVQGTIQFSLGILAEAGLSYVGLGAQPPTPSWGRMLADSQTFISFAPHMALFPGLAILLTVLGLNLMGDGLRDLFDPKLRRGRT